MLAAGLVAALFHYFGWPKVIGYIAAGALMGLPAVKPFVIANEDSVNTLANLGVIFLMFTLGLELNIRKLKKMGSVAFPAAGMDIFVMLLLGYALGRHVLGWEMLPSLFLGAVVCDSSTTLLAKSLEEMGCAKERFSTVIFSVTLSEDIITIGVMAILTGLALTGQFAAEALARQLGLLLLFLSGVLGFGLLVLPRFLDRLGRMRDDETLLIIILGICFGISFIAEHLRFSLALGAFLVGAVVSESRVSHRVHERTAALRDMFSAMFFVTIGLMVNLRQMWEHIGMVVLLTCLVLAGKTLTNLLSTFLLGQPHRDALKIGVGLAQIGDFSYLVALLGITLNHGAEPYPAMYQIAVGTSVLTTVLNPFLLKASVPFGEWLDRKLPGQIRRILENYHAWTQRAGKGVAASSRSAEFQKNLAFLLLTYVLVAVVFAVAHFFNGRKMLWERMPYWLNVSHSYLLWGACLLLTIPLAMSAFLCARRLGGMIAAAMVPAFLKKNVSDAMSRVTELLVTLLLMTLLGMEFVSLNTLLYLEWWQIVATALVTVVAVYFSWQKIRRLAEDGQNTLLMVLEREETPMEAVGSSQVVVPAGSCLEGRTLSELRLRNRVGISILSIQRTDGATVANPGPRETLQTGDALECSGTEEQLRALGELAAATELPPLHGEDFSSYLDLQVAPIRVAAGSPACGHSLKELRLRNQTGATVLRIVRPGQPPTENPGPDFVVMAGYTLYVIGTTEQLASANALLAPEE